MVEKLFKDKPPRSSDRVLEPGCGDGAFIRGLIRWSKRTGMPLPQIVGIDLNPDHVAACREAFRDVSQVTIRHADFLCPTEETFQYVVGNPPYVAITELNKEERAYYRGEYQTAKGRFDLYFLFWEQALRMLQPEGRIVFITPEKFLYLGSAAPLRAILSRLDINEIEFADESTFGDLVTYPVITTVSNQRPTGPTHVRMRDGVARSVDIPDSSDSWLPAIQGAESHRQDSVPLGDIALRVSCGVATGADAIFVSNVTTLDPELHPFARPTIAGREIKKGDTELRSDHVMLLPYDSSGKLLPEWRLGALGAYLSQDQRRAKLLSRTCVQRKPWYAFHETPPLDEMLRPKIICKDIVREPFFLVDRSGEIVPRHSVYYIVPRDPGILEDLAIYLNSDEAREWLHGHCTRAANGYLRLQSHVLKRLPIPRSLHSARDEPRQTVLLSA